MDNIFLSDNDQQLDPIYPVQVNRWTFLFLPGTTKLGPIFTGDICGGKFGYMGPAGIFGQNNPFLSKKNPKGMITRHTGRRQSLHCRLGDVGRTTW